MPFWGRKANRSLLHAALWHTLSGCSLIEKIPFEQTKIKIVYQTSPNTKEPEIFDPEPSQLPANRLVRRLTLDIGLRLPESYEIESFSTQPSSRTTFVASLLSQAAAPSALAALHARMWHLNDDDLPDLDELASTDSTFKDQLSLVRSDILKEPILLVRKVLEDRISFKRLLTGALSITTQESRDFFGLIDEGPVWPSEPYRFVAYHDQREEGGLLNANGWLSAFSGRRDNKPKHRTNRILAELTCTMFESPKAHLFQDLSDEDIVENLSDLATNRRMCAGCHQGFSDGSLAFSGLATGSTFSNWKTFQKPRIEAAGRYKGTSFSGLTGLADAIGHDPQFMRCEGEKIVGALLQRPPGMLENPVLSRLLDMEKNDPDWLTSLGLVFQSNPYGYAPVTPKTKGLYIRQASGVRFLRRHHFEALLLQWAPERAQAPLDMALEPGIDEVTGGDDMVPSGPYWHAVDRFVKQLADSIVSHDLADTMDQSGRRLLTLLPGRSGFGASDTIVTAQIIALWQILTTETLERGSETLVQFKNVWDSTGPITTAADVKRAWNAILIAMFSHPEFITY